MSIKHHVVRLEEAPPPSIGWGVVTEPGQFAHVVRFELADRSVSFAWAAVRRWEFMPGTTDKLLIEVGEELVTLRGRGLAVVRDALDKIAVLVLRAKAPDVRSDRTGAVISDITIESR